MKTFRITVEPIAVWIITIPVFSAYVAFSAKTAHPLLSLALSPLLSVFLMPFPDTRIRKMERKQNTFTPY